MVKDDFMSQQEVADKLGLSVSTIKNYIREIKESQVDSSEFFNHKTQVSDIGLEYIITLGMSKSASFRKRMNEESELGQANAEIEALKKEIADLQSLVAEKDAKIEDERISHANERRLMNESHAHKESQLMEINHRSQDIQMAQANTIKQQAQQLTEQVALIESRDDLITEYENKGIFKRIFKR